MFIIIIIIIIIIIFIFLFWQNMYNVSFSATLPLDNENVNTWKYYKIIMAVKKIFQTATSNKHGVVCLMLGKTTEVKHQNQ